MIERQWRKRSAHMGGSEARQCPKGWILTGWNVYQPDGQRILYQDLSAFIRVYPVKRSFVTMMDTDVIMIVKTVAGFVIRHLSHPRSSPVGYWSARFLPKGWILTGWNALSARRSKDTLSGFIGVHLCSSCKKESLQQTNKSVWNNDARRWTQM